MQLQLGEIEEYIKAKGYSDHIANKVGMIELYEDKLTLTDTDIALENLFINTGINKDTTLNDAIDIGIVAEHLLKKKEGDISSDSSYNINRLSGDISKKIDKSDISGDISYSINELEGDITKKKQRCYCLRFYGDDVTFIETQAKQFGLTQTALLKTVIKDLYIKKENIRRNYE